jgi:probable F420-dependent oxidoreductase
MKFSLWPNAVFPARDIVSEAQAADAAGWHGVWIADHYMPNTADGSVVRGDVHEAWALLPAIAATTERVRIGSLVAPTSVHHPAVLANRAATVDHLSQGRMTLGLGAGWQVNEHAAYGIELERPGARVTRFEESVTVIRSLLSEPRTTYAGRVFTLTDAVCDPKPVQQRLPILVGTKSPRMLRITARHADAWNTWGTPEGAAAARRLLVEACERVGRDPSTVWCSVNARVFHDRPVRPGGPAAVGGSTDELLDTMGAYAEAGFDEFVLPDVNLGDSLAQRGEAIDRFKTEVADRLG